MKKSTEIGRVEGTVMFDRAKEGDTPCTCCPNGRHIWVRYIALERVPGPITNATVTGFMRDLLQLHPEVEGRKMQVAFFVVDD